MATTWTPTPLPLNAGPPFPYDVTDISGTSQTSAFKAGIDLRDDKCGTSARSYRAPSGSEEGSLYIFYLLNLTEKLCLSQWKLLRSKGLIPQQSKSVKHEARNGVLLCKTHRGLFDAHVFYIRWEPVVRVHSNVLSS
jgi:hypothetical protein